MIELYRSPRPQGRLGDDPTPPDPPPPETPLIPTYRAGDWKFLVYGFGPLLLTIGVSLWLTWRFVGPVWWKYIGQPIFRPKRRR